jgi:hypothetical protein
VAPDQRHDSTTRTRYDELAESWHQATARLDARYRYLAWLLIAGLVAVVLASAVGYGLLQHQRWEQTRDGCERTNRITEATVGLLLELKVHRRTVEIAQRRYPHVPPLITPPRGYSGPMSCSGFADERVGWPRL